MKHRNHLTRLTALVLALTLLLTSCGGGTSAATMHLRKTEGTVGVSDGEGKDVAVKDDLGLHSGYQVGTQAESYAWIDLDRVKLTKMDAGSQVEITKDGKKLEINVKSGSLFFNVTEPLADDETMDIRTSSMVVGIRGTCGWVTQDTAALLEGTVEVTAGDQTASVTAGEMAVLTGGALEVKPLGDIPAFVRAELEDGGTQPEGEGDASGSDPDAPADPMRLRDMYTYSRMLHYDMSGLVQTTEFFPDEQGRIGRHVTHSLTVEAEFVTEYIYNDAGVLEAEESDNHVIYVTENDASHRKLVRSGDVNAEYITYYDEQGRETREDAYFDGEFYGYNIFTYDTEGRLIRSDDYRVDGSETGIYSLYEYD